MLYENIVDLYFSSIKSEVMNMNACSVKQKILKDSDTLELHKKIIVCFRVKFRIVLKSDWRLSDIYPNKHQSLLVYVPYLKFLTVPSE